MNTAEDIAKDRVVHALRGDIEDTCRNCGGPAWRRHLSYHRVPQPPYVVANRRDDGWYEDEPKGRVVCSALCGADLAARLGPGFYCSSIG